MIGEITFVFYHPKFINEPYNDEGNNAYIYDEELLYLFNSALEYAFSTLLRKKLVFLLSEIIVHHSGDHHGELSEHKIVCTRQLLKWFRPLFELRDPFYEKGCTVTNLAWQFL